MPQPPSFHPRSRNPRVGPLNLPGGGRRGRVPSWPLGSQVTQEQRQLWVRLWRTPQAVAWEHLGWTRVVARYVLVVLEAEHGLDPKVLAQAVALEDRLGLTPKAMRLLLWTVDHGGEQVEGAPAGVASLEDRRQRLAGGA